MSTSRSRRALVVQPYVPHYRVPFFERLATELRSHEVDLTVAHGEPSAALAARDDAAALDGAHLLRQTSFRMGRRTLFWRHLSELASRADAVVLEQALHNLDAYPLLINPRSAPAVALWGHGRTYNKASGVLTRTLNRRLTHRADWFFAYTQGGADHLAAGGFPSERITVVRNSTDTAPLREALAAVTPEQVERFASDHGVVPERTALFLGSLDESKRIPYLLEAVQHTARLLPGFTLLVAGDGPQRPLVESAAARHKELVYLGPVFGRERALLGAVAQLMLMPGLVGLCAVDSFALATPMVTTHWPYHGPEFEYLEHGRNSLIVAGGPERYAEEVVHALSRPDLLARLRDGCAVDADRCTVREMSRRFAGGVLRMCGA
ncbi:glycosyltransferase family 4 protein [Streptacidiphilus sp. EB129]|uniref:glycosyltransferase family 4 protein n=1 Tax=Streptacidiphilus sp. EB129 TaxID=3156262 RepID=UPI0035186CF0